MKREFLRHLVDVVWNDVTESEEVPATIHADELIDKATETFEHPTHREQMEYFKKYDPIHYSELTGNPTGTDPSKTGCGGVIFGLIITAGIVLIGWWLISSVF